MLTFIYHKILAFTSILPISEGNPALTPLHPLTLIASLIQKHSPFVTAHSVYLGARIPNQRSPLLFANFISIVSLMKESAIRGSQIKVG